MMAHADLFSGIGGWPLGFQWAGCYETKFLVEINDFCRNILAERFHADVWKDVTKLDGRVLREMYGRIDVLTCSPPCQDYSVAGRRAGIDGERGSLWAPTRDIIRDLEPRYVCMEQVPGVLAGDWWGTILRDMAEIGFDGEWECISSAAIGGPTLRERVWAIFAHPERIRQSRSWRCLNAFGAPPNRYRKADGFIHAFQRDSMPFDCGRNHGLSGEVDETRERLQAIGNAIDPGIAAAVGAAIVEFEAMR